MNSLDCSSSSRFIFLPTFVSDFWNSPLGFAGEYETELGIFRRQRKVRETNYFDFGATSNLANVFVVRIDRRDVVNFGNGNNLPVKFDLCPCTVACASFALTAIK